MRIQELLVNMLQAAAMLRAWNASLKRSVDPATAAQVHIQQGASDAAGAERAQRGAAAHPRAADGEAPGRSHAWQGWQAGVSAAWMLKT